MHRGIVGFAVASIVVAASPVHAQSTRADEDYGALLRRATEGREPVVEEQVVEEPVVQAAPRKPRPESSSSVRLDPDEDADDSGSSRWTLHQSAEYVNEPHRVTIVDRSRYPREFLPVTIQNTIGLSPGSILIDTKARQLFFGMADGTVRRYGVAVGKEGAVWHGQATVGRTARWPDWRPTANIRKENRRLKRVVKGGASNPLGARAIYLYQGDRDTMYRIHGTNVPSSIGKYASHGCIRMINEDVIELHSMVRPGAQVTVR